VAPLIARYCQASSRCQRWAELELIDRERRMVERRIKEARLSRREEPWPPGAQALIAIKTLTPNSYGKLALPLPIHSTSGAWREYSFQPR
jgi:hypothetical protein